MGVYVIYIDISMGLEELGAENNSFGPDPLFARASIYRSLRSLYIYTNTSHCAQGIARSLRSRTNFHL